MFDQFSSFKTTVVEVYGRNNRKIIKYLFLAEPRRALQVTDTASSGSALQPAIVHNALRNLNIFQRNETFFLLHWDHWQLAETKKAKHKQQQRATF